VTREMLEALAIVNGLQLLLAAFLVWFLELTPEALASGKAIADALLGARGATSRTSGNSWRGEPYDG